MPRIKSKPKQREDQPRTRSSALNALESIVNSKSSPVDIKDLAYECMHQVKGNAGFVAVIMEEYSASAAGSLARSRILDIIVRLFQLATPKEKFGDLGHLSDDDLMGILNQGLNRPGKRVLSWTDHVCI